MALRLLGLLRAGLAAGGIRGALVPPVARRLAGDDPEAARQLGSDAFVSVLAALALVAAAAALGMPVLVRLAAPGLAGDADGFALAVTLARVMLPCLVLGGPALVLCALLNGAGRFAAASSMALLFNLSALAGLFALGPVLGSPAHGLAAGGCGGGRGAARGAGAGVPAGEARAAPSTAALRPGGARAVRAHGAGCGIGGRPAGGAPGRPRQRHAARPRCGVAPRLRGAGERAGGGAGRRCGGDGAAAGAVAR